ncbi:MAG TPA: ABC transporter ATP-binding protein [Thermotogota bacterium]|nr:ABC transporter ATP-binding protein [Thermotogota bacterium]HPJ89893.1 ABC transporter ATP-binding protein [Thermotogota bacterium]
MIRVQNLTHRYNGNDTDAVHEVNFEIAKGEIFGFLGPSGAGKSTVQNILIGLLPLQKGAVTYDSDSLKDLNKRFFEKIGVSFELPNVYEKLTGYENLKYYAGLFSRKTDDPDKILERVGLADARNKKAQDYSKGMKQRLVFARAIINNPEILFLDEPLSGLDPATAREIKEIIRERKRQNNTIFLTTHNMFVAEELCDRVAFINEGKLVAMDTPKNLKLQYGTKSVKVEYKEGTIVKSEIFFLDKGHEKDNLSQLMKTKDIITVHSQEATLEQIFIKLTGRELM